MKTNHQKIIYPFVFFAWIAVFYFGFMAIAPIPCCSSNSEAARVSMHYIVSKNNFYVSLIIALALNYLYLRSKK